jgi:hypothetical protein
MPPTPDPRINDLVHLQVLTLAAQLQSRARAEGRTTPFAFHINEAAALLKEYRKVIDAALVK